MYKFKSGALEKHRKSIYYKYTKLKPIQYQKRIDKILDCCVVRTFCCCEHMILCRLNKC